MTTDGLNIPTLTGDLHTLFEEVQVLCGDLEDGLPREVELVQDSLSDDELRDLLNAVLVYLRNSDPARADESRDEIAANVRALIESAVTRRKVAERSVGETMDSEAERGPAAKPAVDDGEPQHLALFAAQGLDVRPVRPAPTFLGQDVQLTEGFANTLEIQFWEDNLRLKLDLENFRRREGREPDPEELRDLLWPKGSLPKDDEYKIIPLADDIATRGVRTPPVIDYWGTAWDGNRRLAACRYILASSEYSDEQKNRARSIRVWQTDEHATEDQIDSIVTSLNFGGDFKLEWTEYIRARLVYDAYTAARDDELSRHVLSERDETRIRQKIARKFGIKTNEVTRYCKMVVWAIEFEDYHREQERDEVEISNRTNALFQYFYELDSGRGDDKLALKLQSDDGFRAVVFDLMFDGKFKNWAQIRELRRVYENPAAIDKLKEAHKQPSKAVGQEYVAQAIYTAKESSITLRQAGRGEELARITKWLNEDATLAVLRKLDVEVLREFRDAARAVDSMITTLVGNAPAPAVEAS